MAPKKKGGKGKAKSGASAAAEAELAKELEKLRFEKERERVRNEEFQLRQRLEEEEHKVLESHRVRVSEIRNAITERDRQLNYLAREKELRALLDQRERDTQELRAKVLGLQQAHTVLEKEKESAGRRATMLMGELRTVQNELVDVQEKHTLSNAEQDERYRALKAENDSLQSDLISVRGELASAQATIRSLQAQVDEFKAAAAEEGRMMTGEEGSEENILRTNPRSADAESAVLLNVLHAEVEKYKEIAATAQASVERKSRDEEKSSLLIGILNSQLDSIREENKRLHARTKKYQEESDAAHACVVAEKERNREMAEEMDRAASEAVIAQRQLQLEASVHKKQTDELTQRLDELTEAHNSLLRQHEEAVTKSTEREQEDFRVNVSMKSELDKQKVDLARVAKEKQDVEDEAFNYKILTRAEMDGLRTRLQKFQETMEKKDRESYETINVLRGEAERKETERQREVNNLNARVERLQLDLDFTRDERDRTKTELTVTQEKAAATEKELYEKLVHMTACHDAKHQEVERLQERLSEKEEAFTNTTIFLKAEKANLMTQLEELSAEATKRREEHLQHIHQITGELTELRTRMTAELSSQETLCQREKSRAELAERNVSRLQGQVRELQADARTTELNTEDAVKALKTEARELRSELAIAKRTIERLEAAFGDQAGYLQLRDLNERLRSELEVAHSKVAHMSTVIASMKLEEDVMGGYKLQKAREDAEQLQRRVRQLERERRLVHPLFTELRALAERSSGMDSNLRAALDIYDRETAQAKRTDAVAPVAAAVHADAAVAAEATSSGAAVDGDMDAAGDRRAGGEDVTSTLPAVIRPHPPAGPRIRVLETYFDKHNAATSAAAAAVAENNGVTLPSINA